MEADLTPLGIGYTHDAASKAYDDQTGWIDALDTKSGILMAADGVIAGLILSTDSALTQAPKTVGIADSALLFTSLVLALLAFGTRKYEVAPDVDQLLSRMHHLDDQGLQWVALQGIVNALDVNESKVARKANFLFYSGAALLVAVLVLAGYFVYFLF